LLGHQVARPTTAISAGINSGRTNNASIRTPSAISIAS